MIEKIIKWKKCLHMYYYLEFARIIGSSKYVCQCPCGYEMTGEELRITVYRLKDKFNK